jgi:hypothetical protein
MESSATHAQVLPSPILFQNCLPPISSIELDRHLFSFPLAELNCTQRSTNWIAKIVSLITILNRPNREHRFQQ